MSGIVGFTAYMNEFYGVNGVYASTRNLTVAEVADAIVMLLSGGHPDRPNYVWGGGDSVDREVVRDLVFSDDELKAMF